MALEHIALLIVRRRAVSRGLRRVLVANAKPLLAGEADLRALSDQGLAQLQNGHMQAAYLGRQAAGLSDPIGDLDRVYGESVAGGQVQFYENFLRDVESGRYGGLNEDGEFDADLLHEKAIGARCDLYGARMRGTANESFCNSVDPSELLYWETAPAEHCGTCLDLESRSPYKPSEMPTWPGAGETECSVGCKCGVRTESGLTGF